jgi:hypothetical protein
MNRIAVLLGTAIVLLSALSVLFINLGVVPSAEYPGRFTYVFPVNLAGILVLLLPVIGFVTAWHAIREKRFLEFGLSVILILWGFWLWWMLSIHFSSAGGPFIKGSLSDESNRLLNYFMPGIILGIALLLDGIIDVQRRFGRH